MLSVEDPMMAFIDYSIPTRSRQALMLHILIAWVRITFRQTIDSTITGSPCEVHGIDMQMTPSTAIMLVF